MVGKVQVRDNRAGGSFEDSIIVQGRVINTESSDENLFLDLDTGYTIVIEKVILQSEIVLEKLRGAG